jgi:hypothetical protein
MNKKQMLFLGLSIFLLIATFVLKEVDNAKTWITYIAFYSLGVHWAYSFIFNKDMILFTVSYNLSPDNDDHKPLRIAIFVVACVLIICVLVGVN